MSDVYGYVRGYVLKVSKRFGDVWVKEYSDQDLYDTAKEALEIFLSKAVCPHCAKPFSEKILPDK